MGKKDKNKKKGKGAEKTALKTDKKLAAKQKKMLKKIGEADINEFVKELEAEQSRLTAVTEVICPAPSPRSSFSLVAHPEKEELILFGGEFYNGQSVRVFNDLFFYNIGKNEWKQVSSPAGPTPRSSHQMVSVATDGGQLWLFGGEHPSPSQTQFFHYKDLWMMSLKTKKWEKIVAPNGPSARSGHRMTAGKKRLVVFGGFHDNNQSYQYFNDVHIFSMETYAWLPVKVGGAILPPPRSGCCIATCPDGKVLIWSGYSRAPMQKKEFDRGITHTDMFALVPDKNDPNVFKWNSIKPSGFRPQPRSSVGYCSAANGKAYCFGGVMDIEEDEEDLKGQFGEELLALDLSTQYWQKLELNVTGKDVGTKNVNSDIDMEAPVAQTTKTDGIFTMTVAGPSNNSSSTLQKMPSLFPKRRPVNVPCPRMKPGLCVCKGNLYLYGGLSEDDNKQLTFSDFYSLDLRKPDQWKVLIQNDLNTHEWIDSDESDSEESTDSSDDDDTDSEMDTD